MSSRRITIISSSSEDDENRYANITDEKKRKRMISNRESARRSRMKREQHVKDLNDQVTYFRTRSNEMARKISEIEPRYAAVESENRVLRMQGEELKKRLELLENMLVVMSRQNARNDNLVKNDVVGDEDEGFVMDVLQDPHSSLNKPWMHYPTFQSQTTVDGIYQF